MAFQQDVSGSGMVPNYWKKALNDGIYFNKTCQALMEYYMPGSIDYTHFLSTTTKWYSTRNAPLVYVKLTKHTRYRFSKELLSVPRRQKRQRKKDIKGKNTNKWNKNIHALREQPKTRIDKVAGFFCWWCCQSYDVSRWWTTEGRQKKRDGRKTSQEEGRDKEPKKTVDRNVCLCFRVIRCDIALYIAIYRDIISHIMRYHKIRYVKSMSYPYPEFWGLIWRYRISPKDFLIPNTSWYYCHQAGKRSMRTDEDIHKKCEPNTDHRPTTMASNTVLRCLKSRAKACPRVYMKSDHR